MKSLIAAFMFGIGSLSCVVCAADKPLKSVEPVSIAFTIVGWTGEIQGLSYVKNGKAVRLAVPAYSASQIYHYTGPAGMAIYRDSIPAASQLPSDSEDGRVATVAFDPKIKNAVVLLSKTGEAYQAMAIPADRELFPEGVARIQNLSPVAVSVLCNKKTLVTIVPGEVKWAHPDDNGLLDADMAFYGGDRWVRMERNYFPILKTQQTAIFFLKSEADFFKTANGVSSGGAVQVFVLRRPLPETDKSSDS